MERIPYEKTNDIFIIGCPSCFFKLVSLIISYSFLFRTNGIFILENSERKYIKIGAKKGKMPKNVNFFNLFDEGAFFWLYTLCNAKY